MRCQPLTRWDVLSPCGCGEAGVRAGTRLRSRGPGPRRRTGTRSSRTCSRLHHRRLVGLASLLVDDRRTAEDVVQEAFAGLYRRWRHLRDPDAAVAFLNRAVVNGGRDALRRKRRAGAAVLRLVPRSELLASAEHAAVEHAEHERLWAAVTALAHAPAAGAGAALLPRPERGRDRRHARRLPGIGQEAREPRDRRARPAVGGPVMSTRNVERELTALLHRHAEDAMNQHRHPGRAEPALRRPRRRSPAPTDAPLAVVRRPSPRRRRGRSPCGPRSARRPGGVPRAAGAGHADSCQGGRRRGAGRPVHGGVRRRDLAALNAITRVGAWATGQRRPGERARLPRGLALRPTTRSRARPRRRRTSRSWSSVRPTMTPWGPRRRGPVRSWGSSSTSSSVTVEIIEAGQRHPHQHQRPDRLRARGDRLGARPGLTGRTRDHRRRAEPRCPPPTGIGGCDLWSQGIDALRRGAHERGQRIGLRHPAHARGAGPSDRPLECRPALSRCGAWPGGRRRRRPPGAGPCCA